MDGSRRQTLFKSRLAAPASITIDYLAGDKRIYWADHKLNTIETAKPDGSNRVVVIKNGRYTLARFFLFSTCNQVMEY